MGYDHCQTFEIFTIELVQELDDVTWRDVDVVISHVVELEKVKVLGSGLSNELEHVTISTAASDGFLRSIGCLVRSELLELLKDVLSGNLVGNVFLQPWVLPDLLKGWSLLAIIAENAQDQVLELR